MKNYSFSNIANEETYATRKSNDFSNLYRHSELKSSEANLRIEEIKKKYDTPSRRERIESLKKSKDSELLSRPTPKQDPKEGIYQYRPPPTFGSNHLKESFAVNRLEKSTLKNDLDNKDFMNMRCPEPNYRRSNDKQNEYASFKSNNREEEEVIFSKVREMKESIINSNDYMKNSINPRSSITSNKYANYADSKYDSRKEFDPRVENIDKINSKIKQILNCLSQNEKNPSKYLKEPNNSNFIQEEAVPNKQSAFFGNNRIKEISDSKKSYEGHYHKGSDVVQKYNIYNPSIYNQRLSPSIEETKQIQKSTFIEEKESKFEPNNSNSKSSLDYKYRNRDYSVNKAEPNSRDYSVSRPFKRDEEVARTPTYLNKEYSALKASRSRSQIDFFKKSTLAFNNQNSDVLKSGKKLNDEISKIQKKIEEFEKEKRKLNIEFTPFTLKNKSSANLNSASKPENTKEQTRKNEQGRPSIGNERSSSNDYKFKSYMNRASAYQQKYGEYTNKSRDSLCKEITKSTSIYDNTKPKYSQGGEFELRMQQIEVKTVRIDNNVDTNEQESINQTPDIDSAAIKKRTDDGIEERRKRLQGADNDIITTESLKKIVSLFCQQVRLDQCLRNMKIWLETCFESDKFNRILKYLEKQGVSMSLKECEAIFKVDQSQHNPFFSAQGFQGSYQSLISAYIEADRHWKTQVLSKFDKSNLICQGFTCQKIDLQRKGYIELQDLVRFLNIQSGTFYRNRDLFLIFHRFTPTERLNFEDMLGEICA